MARDEAFRIGGSIKVLQDPIHFYFGGMRLLPNDIACTYTCHLETGKSYVQAWSDPEIARYIELDIELYEHAVNVHHKQLAQCQLE